MRRTCRVLFSLVARLFLLVEQTNVAYSCLMMPEEEGRKRGREGERERGKERKGKSSWDNTFLRPEFSPMGGIVRHSYSSSFSQFSEQSTSVLSRFPFAKPSPHSVRSSNRNRRLCTRSRQHLTSPLPSLHRVEQRYIPPELLTLIR